MATPATEQALLDVALAGTAAHVEAEDVEQRKRQSRTCGAAMKQQQRKQHVVG